MKSHIVMCFVFKIVIIQFLILSCLLLFRQRFSSSHQKMLSFWYPGYPEVFLACGGNLPCRPKAEATSGGTTRKKTLFARGTMNEDMTETGNRARKVSGMRESFCFQWIAGPSFPWLFPLGFTLNEFFGETFSLAWFLLVSCPPPRPHHFSNSPSLIKIIGANNVRKNFNVVCLWYPTLWQLIWKGRSCILLLHQI